MPIKGVDAVLLGIEDLSAGGRFYADFGLNEVARGSTYVDFTTLDGSEILLRRSDDAGLPSAVAAGPTVREIVWAVESDEDLAEIARELQRDRQVVVDADGSIHSTDEDGYGIAFRRDRRAPIRAAASKINIYGAEPGRPINSRIDFLEAIRPVSIAHIVLFSLDAEKAAKFYIERLKFRVTDRFTSGRGTFLRASGSSTHHNLFVIQGDRRGLHHIAFPVADFNDVVLAGQGLLEHGWTSKVGPGRHKIGSNYFWYFDSPCGGAMELTADLDCADDNWVAKDWDFTPQNTSAWSTTFKLP